MIFKTLHWKLKIRLRWETANANVSLLFEPTRIETTISYTRCERANNDLTEVIFDIV
jgi:hypothetical protein